MSPSDYAWLCTAHLKCVCSNMSFVLFSIRLCDKTSHKDFVRGLSWERDEFLLSCGWDGTISHHSCNRDRLDSFQEAADKAGEGVMESEDGDNHKTSDSTNMEVTHQLNGLSRGNCQWLDHWVLLFYFIVHMNYYCSFFFLIYNPHFPVWKIITSEKKNLIKIINFY